MSQSKELLTQKETLKLAGTEVRVYRNLHKGCMSVQNRKTGIVEFHADRIALKDAVFNVRQGGRQRVIEEQRKNVHAFVEGTICDLQDFVDPQIVTYNPYKYDSFVIESTEDPIQESSYVYIADGKVYADLASERKLALTG